MKTFTPTQWETSADKLKFYNQFIKFVSGGFKRSDFPKWFYVRLSMTFGHIAHYNQQGFWDVYFTSDADKKQFIKDCLAYPHCGDPAWTYSDVETALVEWLNKNLNCY